MGNSLEKGEQNYRPRRHFVTMDKALVFPEFEGFAREKTTRLRTEAPKPPIKSKFEGGSRGR